MAEYTPSAGGSSSQQQEQQQGGSLMSPAPIVRGGNSTQQLQPPAPDGRGSCPAPRRTPSGNILVWNGVGFVKLPGDGCFTDEELGVEMEDEDDII